MARLTSSIAKKSRREGYALHPKAHKILARRQAKPGQHGHMRARKPSQYSMQLREKQKIRLTYGLMEKQFSKLMKEAAKSSGNSGSVLLMLLERRLDNVVFRAGFAGSRQAARQVVNHGHITVNGKKVDIPSYRVKIGDEIKVSDKSKKNGYFTVLEESLKHADSNDVAWVSADSKKLVAKVTALPTREDIDQSFNEQLVVEYYSR